MFILFIGNTPLKYVYSSMDHKDHTRQRSYDVHTFGQFKSKSMYMKRRVLYTGLCRDVFKGGTEGPCPPIHRISTILLAML